MKYKHIVFDIDGTLIDTEYAVLHSLQETIKGLSGREIPCSELRFALGITGIHALKKLEIKDASYAIELWDKKMCSYTNTIQVFDFFFGNKFGHPCGCPCYSSPSSFSLSSSANFTRSLPSL